MLVIVEDPTGTHANKRHPLDCSISLHENVARHIESGGDYEVWLNGQRIEEPATSLGRIASIADSLTVIRRPEGFDPFTWVLIATAAAAVAVIALMPKIQSYGQEAGAGDSPNNRLTGQTNVARTYEAKPDVYGKVRCWPDLIQNSTFEYIDNIKRVTEWLLVSRGKGSVTDLKYADTPLTDITGSVSTIFEPVVGSSGLYEHGTTTITEVLETFDSPEVNGQELTYPTAWANQTASAQFDAIDTESTFTITTPVNPMWDDLVSLAGTGSALVEFTYDTSETFYDTRPLLSVATVGSDYVFEFSNAPPWVDDFSEAVTIDIRPIGFDYHPIGPYTLPVEGDRLRWHINFPRGLKGSVEIKAEWWAIDDDGAEISGTRASQNNTASADSFDAQYRTYGATPADGTNRYRIQFERRSAQIGSDGIDVAKLEEAVIGKYFASKTLPGDTIIKIVTTATNQATGYSERKFNCEFARHVLPLVGSTHSASRNFARAIRHMWAVARRDAAQLDVESLAEINAAHGESNELLRFDYTFANADQSLGDRLQAAANTARCQIYRDGNQWVTYRDELRALGASRQLDYRNLHQSGESSIAESGHMPASEDGVEVEYVNADGKTKAYARLSISSDGIVSAGLSSSPLKIKLPGCRTTAQALNRAHMEARKIIYQRRRVSDTALMDAASMGLGDVVRWIDPNDFLGDDGLQAGEVLGVSGLTITTSEPLHFGAEASGRIVFTGADGASSTQVICTPRTDGVSGCVLSSLPGSVYLASGDRQCGSRYAFGVGLTESELESAGLYVLESKKPSGDGRISIELASYDARFYQMD